MEIRLSIRLALALLLALPMLLHSAPNAAAFINFETAPVHPIALSPDGSRLAVCNLPDGKLELFDVTGPKPILMKTIPVGVDPVAVRFRSTTEAWVVNHISDSVSVVDLPDGRVVATIDTMDTPADVVFAGTPVRAFVSCALPNTIQVFDPASRLLITNLVIDAERPKALAVSVDGAKVFAAAFESGNATTIVGARFKNQLFIDNVVSLTNAPSAGSNPALNASGGFNPPLNPALPTNLPAPGSGLIVRRNAAGRWLDDQSRDWTEYVSGTNAALTQRVPGWDLPDRDLAVIDAQSYAITYATGLMNICMAAEVNPVSGLVAVIGTDARNEVRFEPNLNGTFIQVRLALVDPASLQSSSTDLNPHLDYSTATIAPDERDKSIGDPRAVAWRSDGTRGYVAGLGSRNVIEIDAAGQRVGARPIEVGEGPCGLTLDDARQRLYVYHRFSSSVSVVDISSGRVVDAVSLFDPTPLEVAAGRRHLYDTRRTSGLGQASCASCHVDARMDRLGWDLGNPAGNAASDDLVQQGAWVTNLFHPMKGVMLTQTLQDIIGHEPFHWRGDRPDIESFNPTFTNLQGAPTGLAPAQMGELREFLASIRMPPNPNRTIDNSFPAEMALPGHFASGVGSLPAGTPLPSGRPLAGVVSFNRAANFCNTCHTLPTGLGAEGLLDAGGLKPVPLGTNQAHHFPVSVRLEGSLRAKNAQFRNLADRIGMDGTRTNSRAGFGFGHDGSVDTLTRFLTGLRLVEDQEVADLIALLLCVSGADLQSPGGIEDTSPPAGLGRQLTLRSPARPPLFDAMLALGRSATSRVDLIAKGVRNGHGRGWYFDRGSDRFQSDRAGETEAAETLLSSAAAGNEITFTVVARGTGYRLGIDRDSDGKLDGDELEAGTNPSDPTLRPRATALRSEVPIGSSQVIQSTLPPAAAPGSVVWFKDGQRLPGETNEWLMLPPAGPELAGEYVVGLITPFGTNLSPPLRLSVVPLIVTATPEVQWIRQGSNAVFNASYLGNAPGSYQWQFQGRTMAEATGSALVIPSVGLANEGEYCVVAANEFGMATSAPVRLGVLIGPTVVMAPLNQSAVAGANATFSFQVTGHPPPFGFQLKRSATLLTNYVTDEPLGFLTLYNVQAAAAGTYRIVVTNAANPSPGLALGPVTLSILADSDHDGLPDAWELAHGLNPNNAGDAELDPDLDGLSNFEEFEGGTEPLDGTNVLEIGRIVALPGTDGPGTDRAVIEFEAASNRTYTVELRANLQNGNWTKLADVVAAATNRTIRMTNSMTGVPERYFRLTTPRRP